MKKNNLLNGLYLYLGASFGYTLAEIIFTAVNGGSSNILNLILFFIMPFNLLFTNLTSIDLYLLVKIFGATIGFFIAYIIIKRNQK